MKIESRVAGIPCLIRVVNVQVKKGSYSPSAVDPDEYHGYTDIEFDVLDRRGRDAPWLANKLTDADRDRIDAEILAAVRET